MSNINQVLSEVYIILRYSDSNLINKIPIKFISMVNKFKDPSYKIQIDENKSLNEQKLLPETRQILALIYRDYLCDEKEREELIKKNNKKREEMNNTYDIKNVFEKRSNNIKEINNEEQLIVVKQEKWYDKIFKFFKNIFRKRYKKISCCR